jgi:hypothetical protein
MLERGRHISENENYSVADMKELTSTSFGYLIAFLLPEMFALYALTYWFPPIGVLLQPMLKPDSNVGPSLILLLIAVGTGMCVSAARFFIFEKGLYRAHCLPPTLYQHMTSEKLALHKTLAEEHYRYHQFYGGCVVATLIFFTGWLRGHWAINCELGYVAIEFVLLGALLERSAADSFKKYIEKCKAVNIEEKHIQAGTE